MSFRAFASICGTDDKNFRCICAEAVSVGNVSELSGASKMGDCNFY